MFKKFFEKKQSEGVFEGVKFEDLSAEQSEELFTMYLDELDAQMSASKEELSKISESNEGLKNTLLEGQKKLNDEINLYTRKLSDINLELAKATTEKIKEISFVSKGDMSGRDAIEEVKKLHEGLNKAVKAKASAEFEISQKVLETALKADTLTSSVSDFTRGVEDPQVTRLAHRRLTAYESIPSKITIPPNQGGTYRYIDQDAGTSVRAAAQVAEGASAPESTIAWVKRFLGLKKTSDHLPYSDEFEYDFRNLMGELIDFLRQNVNIQVDDQIINGDDLGENYKGMLTSIPAYTPVASGITDANLFDLMCKVSEDITDGEGSKYAPDLVFLNSADIVSINYLLKKDTDNNYIPLAQMAEMKGFRVVENNSLAANTMILGDSRYAHIIEDGVLTIKTGLHSGTDAIDGIERVLLTTRKNLLVKELESTGWREVTDIAAALTTLATS